jgi:hypothetical protein
MKIDSFLAASALLTSFCLVPVRSIPAPAGAGAGHWSCGAPVDAPLQLPIDSTTNATAPDGPSGAAENTTMPVAANGEPSGSGAAVNTTSTVEPAGNGTSIEPIGNGTSIEPTGNGTSVDTPDMGTNGSLVAGGNSSSSSLPTFIAGGDIGTVLRQQAIPGRVFHDLDNNTTTDPIGALADLGFNAARVETQNGQCLVTNGFNNANALSEELLFTLDWGCIDIQVNTAKQAAAKGMKIILTINMGVPIPTAWLQNSYSQMVDAITTETKRQLQPFLTAGVVPYIILLENEGSDGMLYTDASGHIRGNADNELCGKVPTGNMNSYPQLAGYYKAEIAACKAAITAAGLDLSTVRFGLHSHAQYVDWKVGVVYGTQAGLETSLTTPDGTKCDFDGVIPDDLLNVKASDELDIIGFSSYPDPIAPTNPNDPASLSATLDRLTTTIGVLDPIIQRYGRATDGPFQGQWTKQAIGVEYATHFTPDQFAAQEQQTNMMFKLIKAKDWFLGMMWYEPWYCYSDWEGGYGALCTKWTVGSQTNVALDPVAKIWGQAAQSSK